MNHSIQKYLTVGFTFWVVFALATCGYLYRYGKKDIRFGIDLVGGTYITLEVQQDDVVKNYLGDKIRIFQQIAKASRLELDGKPMLTGDSLVFKFESLNAAREAESAFKHEESYLKYTVEGSTLNITLPEALMSKLLTEAVESNIDILRSRFASLSEIHISKQGSKQIVVELPDVSDPHQANDDR